MPASLDLVKYLAMRPSAKYICWDFAREAYRDLTAIDIGDAPGNFAKALKNYVETGRPAFVKLEDQRPPCFILFDGRRVPHIGVIIRKNKVLHMGRGGARFENLVTALMEYGPSHGFYSYGG